MHLEYFGRKHLVNALMEGWSPVPGYEYHSEEYAYLLMAEDIVRSTVKARYIACALKREAKISRQFKSNSKAGTASGLETKRQRYGSASSYFITRKLAEVRA
jgi:hypothetical protein